MALRVKNFTFSLPVDLLNRLRELVNHGYINSLNGGVREALEIYIKRVEKKKVYEDMKAAAQDPLFMKDLEDSMKDFSNVDFESEEKDYEI